jgi:hypothetical protein
MAQWRVGNPHHYNGTTPAGGTPQLIRLPAVTVRLVFRNAGSADIELFLTERAAGAGAGNGYTVKQNTALDLEVEVQTLWVYAGTAQDYEILAIGRG